jgi:hypothetical protein
MSDLPRRPIKPLLPPPGSFEQTVARASSRRRRALVGAVSASLAAVAVVAIVGVSSIGRVGAQHDVRPAVPVVSSPPPSVPASPTPTFTATSVSPSPASPTPVVSPLASPSVVVSSVSPTPSPPISSAPASPGPGYYRGRLTDAAHHPLKGYHLYWAYPDAVDGNNRPDAFSVYSLAATTGADGSFRVPGCQWVSQGLLAVLAGPLPAGAQSWTYAPLETGPDNEGAFQVLGRLTIVPTITVPGGCPSTGVVTTVIRPHAIVTATVSIDGRRFDATDAARIASQSPGQSGPDARLQIDLPSPNGEVQLDGIDPDPTTGRVTLTGLGSGEVGFGMANRRVAIPITDGQVLNVAVALTTGTAADGSDATLTVTVVP